ncbi:hypothetical protein Cob_v012179 [Colletotrichum orbiculare MAFF 240422]|uniref:Uncharacterized protein n=1 Tax=Colletotrichum orbiculare (strain 104-T / ATCC 96160 / CBS 514.97 / LARS 414 / MAFF 240422) TaxID=1213857 RepID=A0A484FA43_COLOR|nr:hypothetical protein Cob_v012179 [Colletotrichum orbiculare MAFF 240422]
MDTLTGHVCFEPHCRLSASERFTRGLVRNLQRGKEPISTRQQHDDCGLYRPRGEILARMATHAELQISGTPVAQSQPKIEPQPTWLVMSPSRPSLIGLDSRPLSTNVPFHWGRPAPGEGLDASKEEKRTDPETVGTRGMGQKHTQRA